VTSTLNTSPLSGSVARVLSTVCPSRKSRLRSDRNCRITGSGNCPDEGCEELFSTGTDTSPSTHNRSISLADLPELADGEVPAEMRVLARRVGANRRVKNASARRNFGVGGRIDHLEGGQAAQQRLIVFDVGDEGEKAVAGRVTMWTNAGAEWSESGSGRPSESGRDSTGFCRERGSMVVAGG
jgi:hypothetical protein